MKRKSIFLVITMIFIMGGMFVNKLALRATEGDVNSGETTQINSSECTHEKINYINAGLEHIIECDTCQQDILREMHKDEDNDGKCDICKVKFSAIAPTSAEGFTSSNLTLDEKIKISIKANKEEVAGIVVSAWYEDEMEKRLDSTAEGNDAIYEKPLYSTKAEYNEETGEYETEIEFSIINGEDGKYYFDAIVYGKSSSMRYIRLSEVEYVKNGISKVSTARTDDGTIEISIRAVEGGEIYISTNGEEPTENSNWQAYSSEKTYEIEDKNNIVEEVSVYYRESNNVTALRAPLVTRMARAIDPSAMITEWNIPANNTKIKLPITGTGINVNINWGDGNVQAVTTTFPEHTYTTAGTYDITITGTLPIFGYTELDSVNSSSNYYTFTQYLIGIKQWGELGTTRYGFSNCSNLKYVLGDATANTFANVTTMENMFAYCIRLNSVDLSNFVTNNVTSMENMFAVCMALNEIDITSFNTSKVTTMQGMFRTCSNLKEVKLGNFDTSKVDSFNQMFYNCESLLDLDMGNFVIKDTADISSMLASCGSLKTIILNNNFIPKDATPLAGNTNLKAVILTSTTPSHEQFATVKAEIPNVVFYVPNETVESLYETEWKYSYNADKIQPILKLEDKANLNMGTYDEYEQNDYLVAGIDINNAEEYTKFGYNVVHTSTVNNAITGEYTHEYILQRTINGVTSRIMSVTKKVVVEKHQATTPSDFKATRLADEQVITITWLRHDDPNVKYELSVKEKTRKLESIK